MKKLLLSLALGFLSYSGLNAQGIDKFNFSNIIPPSPDISALGKYTEFPMTYSSGVPVINIPLYKLKSGELEVPVSLSYNASGVKVEEVATWAGLGWNLNTGSSLYRVVHGLPDDASINGLMYTNRTIKKVLEYADGTNDKYMAYHDIFANILDVEPDIYYFSAMGFSGKFYFDQTERTFVQMPRSQVKINYTVNGDNKIVQFILTLPDGTKCYFGKSEDATRTGYENFSSTQSVIVSNGMTYVPEDSGGSTPPHITSWQILDIKSIAGKSINYYYSVDKSVINFGKGGESKDYAGTSGCEFVQNNPSNWSYYAQYGSKNVLEKISAAEGDIYFKTSSSKRSDIIGGPEALDSILVKNKNNTLIKAFKLNTGYWFSDENLHLDIPVITGGDANVVAQYRLYLSSLDEINATLNEKYSHTFEYSNIALPNRLSSSQDYWGYYNRGQNGINLTPKISSTFINGNSGGGYLPGADRRVDTLANQARVLTSVTYPTGGKTTYVYETNRANKQGIGGGDNSGFELSGLIQKSDVLLKSYQYLSPGTTNIYEKTFNIGFKPKPVHFHYIGCEDFNNFSCPLVTTIRGITDKSIYIALNTTDSYFTLPEGSYDITTTINNSFENQDAEFSVLFDWEEQSIITDNSIVVGGLRVKKIVSSDGLGKILSRSFSYNRFHDALYSSGSIENIPVHAFKIPCDNLGGSFGVTRVTSQSAVPLVGGDGQAVRYDNVTEYMDDAASSQKTEYTYEHIGLDNPGDYPFASSSKADWRTNLLILKRDYEYRGSGSYRPVRSTEYAYRNYETKYSNNFGMKFGANANPATFSISNYGGVTEWQVKTGETDSTFTYNGNVAGSVIVKNSVLTYNKNDNYQLSNTLSYGSDGKRNNTRYTYPADYSSSPGFDIAGLKQNNLSGLVLKKENSVNGKIRAGEVLKYNVYGKPIQVYEFESAAGVDTAVVDAGNILTTGYTLKADLSYSSLNNSTPVQVRPANGIPVCYLWSYGAEHPIAEIKNVTYETVKSILGEEAINNFSSRTNPDKAAIDSFIAPLRASAPDAQIITYSYQPLAGTVSQTDATGKTTYFEYDGFQRLKHVKDQNENILKRNDYHYRP
ncbi:hypothetical protein TH53_24680 [Pedobacter lusitanus]|uniref:YD repeat-containing protein n=1 Tax=Pedobacter lusitanus TaxID=1503925 RepID=A0A0D0FQK9_9SPHI|nr:hypothetical protein [Pedobacter lusitanus]KIO74744.1 hypothetical protein TH53_24680 [Pedobacter lusitanus]